METQLGPTVIAHGPPALPRPAAPAFRSAQTWAGDDASQATLAAATAALWIGCLIVGILGVLLPYAREHLQARPAPTPVQAIRLMPPREQEADKVPQVGPRPYAAPPPDLLSPPAPPEAPPPVAVAAPAPTIAFAVPVEGPTRIVDAKLAVPVTPRPKVPVAPPVQHLTFGVGEGRQPNPEYPHDAILAHEEGTVVVRFTVGPDGRVLSAVVSQSSRWPLLNQAALRAVRDEWRLSSGKAGTYDIPIQFVLTGD